MKIKKCCEDIETKGNVNQGNGGSIIFDDGLFYVEYDGGYCALQDIKFCPYCARKLELE